METPNIDKYISICDTDWMSNEDFLYWINKNIERGNLDEEELNREFDFAFSNQKIDWVKRATENGLFKEYKVNPIKGKVIDKDTLLTTVDKIYWDDIYKVKPAIEIQLFKQTVLDCKIEDDETIESLMNNDVFSNFSFALKTKMKYYLGEKELRDKDVVYFLKSIGGDQFFANEADERIRDEDYEFVIQLIKNESDWIELDSIVNSLAIHRNSSRIDTYYVQSLNYWKKTIIMRHHRFEQGSSFLRIK